MASKTVRFNNLTKEQLFEIYNKGKSGFYYIKEICTEFNISPSTYHKVMSAVEQYIKYTLDNGKTPYDL